MPLTIVSGRSSNVTLGSDFTYAATANQGAVPIKNQLVSLRLDNKPVFFRTRTLPSIGDGDFVAAAGSMSNGTLQALALRNMTTGAAYHPPTVMPMVLAVLLVLIGVPLIAFLGLGLLFIGFGGFVFYRCLRVRKAASLLLEQSVPAQA
jgi:hypothetical protein